ncbi:sushi, von Willebrand factor type A, EGF and pentraxin domain-containing protein 1-like [Mercenaria mercenaria]|uniref:sushi, von Willebrand factor type A, EGF and pentraxin domain-containing protein 1-like n=1 Tax=Mercenaria mercenaria TaxID=6596 RepID=UPI00234FACDC|nr:sushi, von Willebrand factor type A, EGF and pentraxin domain-containing protein 1-like [Mercenaria mercenaria]
MSQILSETNTVLFDESLSVFDDCKNINTIETIPEVVSSNMPVNKGSAAAAANSTSKGQPKLPSNSDIMEFLKSLETKIELERENGDLRDQVTYLKSQSMRNNLVFGGIVEEQNEDLDKKLREILANKLRITQSIVNSMKIERIHRMGQLSDNPGQGTCHKVVCKFAYFSDRELVRRQRKLLEGSNYFLHEQFPPEIAAKRRKLIPKLKEAFKDGKKAWIVYDTLYIEGQLSLKEDLKTIKECDINNINFNCSNNDDEIIAVQSIEFWYSPECESVCCEYNSSHAKDDPSSGDIEAVRRMCSGKQSCTLNLDVLRDFSPFGLQKSVYVIIQFHCIPRARRTSVCSSDVELMSNGLPLYLTSENYPSVVTGNSMCSCSFSSCSSNINLYVIDVDLYLEPANCEQSLQVLSGADAVLHEMNCESHYDRNDIAVTNLNSRYVNINFINNSTQNQEGYFFLGFAASDQNANFTLTCRDEPASSMCIEYAIFVSRNYIISSHIDCGAPANVDGANVSTSNDNLENSVATYVCENGHTHTSGDLELTCGSDGKWNGTAPVCTPDCGSPENVDGADVTTSNDNLENSVATYVCENGYTHTSGDLERTCGSNGTWNGTSPVCTPDCGAPENADGANVTTSNDNLENSVATYVCENGYTHTSGDLELTCGSDGKWNGTAPVCTSDCGSPANVDGANVSTSNDNLENSVATYVCENGHTHTSGDLELTCGSDGKWNGTAPVCTPDCGSPANVDGANVTTSNDNLENSVATYVCENGHTHTFGDLERTCGSNGKWNGTAPVCTPDCGAPENVDGANVTTSNDNLENSVATYVCENGYTHTSGDLERTCGSDGKWNGTAPVCTSDCGAPANVDSANVTTSNDNLENSVATYVCENGHTHTSGDLERTCGSNGKWNGTAPVCTPDCGAPANVDGANVSTSNDNLENSVATYVCENGHTHTSGDLERTCGSDGKWNGTAPVCTPDCGTPSNADSANVTTSNGNIENSIATYVCESGYSHTAGDLKHSCGTDGKWNGTSPVCTPDCGTPANVDGANVTTSNDNLENSVATYVCENGYTHTSGDLERTCGSDGKWNGTAPVCTSDCGAPANVEGANVTTSNDNLENSVATYVCENGHTHTSGDLERTCWSDGKWNGTAPVCTPDCGSPANVDGANVTTSNDNLENSVATYVCENGHTHTSGNLERTCGSDGKWNGKAPVCTPGCGSPANVDGANVTTSNDNLENSVATYVCVNGYNHTFGNLERTCESDGDWNGTLPVCTSDCGTPAVVDGASITTSNGSLENSVSTYVCENGYTHTSGDLERTCKSDGNWNGTSPVCTPDCGTPVTVDGANVTTSNGSIDNSVATYFCEDGYTHTSGDLKHLCAANGNWKGTMPVCTRDCGPPENVTGAVITTSNGSIENSTANYICTDGYAHTSGNLQLTCGSESKWNGTVPVCTPDCGPPENITKAVVTTSNGSIENSVATYACENGYAYISGDLQRVCGSDSKWNGSSPACIPDCGSPETVTGATAATSNGSIENSTSTYSCENGYTHTSGDLKRTCDSNGTWSGTLPTCTPDCGNVNTIENGNLTLANINATLVGATATVSCNKGYNISAPSITCLSSGQWESAACSIIDCGQPPLIMHGIISVSLDSSTTYGSIARVVCDTEYKTEKQNVVCKETGSWEKSVCKRKADQDVPVTILVSVLVAVVVVATVAVALILVLKILPQKTPNMPSIEYSSPFSPSPPLAWNSPVHAMKEEQIFDWNHDAYIYDGKPCQLSLKEDLKTLKECDINNINFNCSNNDEIIAVQSLEFWYTPECETVCCEYNSSHTKQDPSSDDIQNVHRMCSGKQSCSLNLDGERARRTSVCSSDVELMSNGLPLYLTSENFPEVATGDGTCSCLFSSCWSNIILYVIDVDLNLDPGNCEQSIQVMNGTNAALHEMNCESYYDRNDITVTNLNSRYFKTNSIDNSTQIQEGYFFLGFAASDQNASFITLTCQDESASSMCIGQLLPQEELKNVTSCDFPIKVTCGSNEIIAVHSLYFWYHATCTGTCCNYDSSHFSTGADSGVIQAVRRKCSGGNECTLVQLDLDGKRDFGSGGVHDPSYIIVKYYCIPASRTTSICSDETLTSAGEPVYLTNENYPSVTTGNSTCSCSLEVFSCTSSINLYILDADMYLDAATCEQTIDFVDGTSTSLSMINCKSYYENRIDEISFSTNYVKIDLIDNSVQNQEGYIFLGFGVSEKVAFKLSCPYEQQTVCRDCGVPGLIPDGKLELVDSSNSSYGSLAEVICDNGYESDDLNVSCLDTGEWESTACSLKDCGTPYDISNGTITPVISGSTTFGTTANVICDEGFKVKGNCAGTQFQCGDGSCIDNSLWCDNFPHCDDILDELLCDGEQSCLEGQMLCGTSCVDSQVGLSCNDSGSTDVEDSTGNISCLVIGKWEVVKCSAKDCGNPVEIQNGNISLTDIDMTTYQSTAAVTCDAGFVASIEAISCQANGTWENASCITDCGPPQNATGASVTTSKGNIENSVATYVCTDGYAHTSGDLQRTCGSDHKWSGILPTCTPDCGDPENVTGASVTTSSNNLESSVATYLCGDGYMHTSGDLERTCTSDSTRNGTLPTCTPDCGDPENVNGATVTTSSNNLESSVATYLCGEGYTHTSGNLERTCTSDSTWNGTLPTCTPDCGDPENVTGATVTTSNKNLEFSVATYVCGERYTHTSGDLQRTCTSDSTWNGTLPTCTPDCGTPPNSTGAELTTSAGTLQNSVATYVCQNGFTHTSGNLMRTCGPDSTWNGTLPTCTPDCGNPENVTGAIVTMSSNNLESSVATYVCGEGYMHTSGDLQRTCTSDSTWNGTFPTCTPYCREPENVTGATVTTSINNLESSVATYLCGDGYTHTSGDLQRTCTSDSTWNGTLPTCTPDSGNVNTIENGNLTLANINTTLVGATATVSCTKGYNTSTISIMCLPSGQWESVACSIIDCGQPPLILHGIISVSSDSDTSYGSTARVDCDTGYKTDKHNVVCKETGSWEISVCKRKADEAVPVTILVSILVAVVVVATVAVALISIWKILPRNTPN